jgi:hypothetical protein
MLIFLASRERLMDGWRMGGQQRDKGERKKKGEKIMVNESSFTGNRSPS